MGDWKLVSFAVAAWMVTGGAHARTLSGDDVPAMVALNRSNEVAFARTYKGRAFAASGILYHVADSTFLGILVSLDTSRGRVVCALSHDRQATVATWSAGDRLQIKGSVDDTLLGELRLEDCDVTEVVDRPDDQLAMPSAPPEPPALLPRQYAAPPPPAPRQYAAPSAPFEPSQTWQQPPGPDSGNAIIQGLGHGLSYSQGYDDRVRYQTWRNSLPPGSAFQQGAFYWEGQRSQPGLFCPNGYGPDFYTGCMTDQRMLGPSDARRHADQEYRAGWNAVPPGG